MQSQARLKLGSHLFLFAFLAYAGLSLSACTSGESSQGQAQATQSTQSTQVAPETTAITAQEAQSQLKGDQAVLLDVRELEEIEDGGMAGPAQWFPFSKIRTNSEEWLQFASQLPKDKEIIIYCKSGGRASHVAKELRELGYKTRNMGGFDDWTDAGLPTKSSVK